MNKLAGILAALGLLMGLSSSSYAAFGLPGLEDTGAVTDGSLGTWEVTAGPASEGPYPVDATVVTAHPAWTAPVGAPWISVSTDGSTGIDGGTYTYTLQFQVPASIDPANVSISGLWSSDNNSRITSLNATPLYTAPGDQYELPFGTPGDYSFQNAKPFTISTGFISGLNTLTFQVDNPSGPSALAVNFTSAVTPEPTTLLVWSGLAAIGAYRRRIAA